MSICQMRNVAVQTIKSIARGPYEGDRTHATWYKPLTEQADIDKAVHWVLSRTGVFLNTAGDIHVLPQVLNAASRSGSQATPDDEQMQVLSVQQAMEPLFV